MFFHHFSKPKNFIFPPNLHTRTPRSGSWASSLINRSQVESLYNLAPWDSVVVPTFPLSFRLTGWYEGMGRLYLDIESTHRQAFWESTHAFPISSTQRSNSPFFALFWRQRKQRRSRFGARWKTFLNHILKGIIAGYCDLDILLDPFFLHYPRPHEDRVWYPGLGQLTDPNSLIDALEIADRDEPWRNQFRNSSVPHPAVSIARLHGKFLPAP